MDRVIHWVVILNLLEVNHHVSFAYLPYSFSLRQKVRSSDYQTLTLSFVCEPKCTISHHYSHLC